MARAKKEAALTPEERLQAALVPDWEWPYKLPENWCWLKLVESFDNHTDSKKKIKQKDYLAKGKLAVVDQGQELIGGYTNDVEKSYSGALPIVIFGDHTRCIKFIDFPFAQGADGVKVLRPKPFYLPKAFYYALQSVNIPNLGYRRHFPLFNKFSIPLPPFAEQQRIVDRIESLFAKLDEAKEKAQAVVDSFETRKAAILHKAFTGELTAKWREEHGVRMESWEHHQFSDLCAIVRGGSPRPAGDPRYYDGNIPFMKVADITRNDSPYVSKVEYSIKEEGLKKTRMVEANTLLLTNSGATLGVPAITTIRTTFNDGIAAFIGIDIDSLLFYYYFWTSKTAFLRSINMGAAQPNLNTKLIGEVEIDVPQTAERVEIARVLNALLSKEQQAKEAAEAVLDQIDLMKKSILARAFRGELGTNDPNEESAVELLKRVL